MHMASCVQSVPLYELRLRECDQAKEWSAGTQLQSFQSLNDLPHYRALMAASLGHRSSSTFLGEVLISGAQRSCLYTRYYVDLPVAFEEFWEHTHSIHVN